MAGLEGAPAERDGRLLWELWRFFAEHDWRASWKSQAAWDLFRTELHGTHDATVEDLAAAFGWLYHCLMPLAAPLPRTDLVHTTIAGFPGLAGIVAHYAWGTPFVVTEHGVWLRERYIAISAGDFTPFAKRFLIDLSRYVGQANYACADIVAPVTAFNRRWELPCGVPAERIVTIPNGVDPALFVPRPKPARTAGRPTVVAAARVFPLKDMETMIRSAAVARREIPDVQYLVYGSLEADPPYVERCRALIAELDLAGTFEFAGHHPKPAELYADGDVCALSSISEAFPYTVLEAMACARPVVATDVGGVKEALDGYGLVVAPRDHEALGGAIVTLLRDDLLRVQMGRQAREAVLARYRISSSVNGYRRLYEGQLRPVESTEPDAAIDPAVAA
jgi:glycosyltransferase involved in cell wall biosynthesis